MGIKLQGGNNSSNLVSVNALHQMQVVTTQDSTGLTAGFVQMSTEVDAGDVVGSRSVQRIECSDDYRTRVGVDQTLFNTTFEGIIILSTQWSNTTATTSSTQANGFLTVNSAAAASMIASGSAAYVRSHRLFPTFGTYPTYLDMWIREGGANAINAISEWGFLHLTAVSTQQPLDGIFFRRTSGGQLKGVVTTGISATVGIDTFEVDLDTKAVPARSNENHSYDPAETNHYLISFHNDSVRFWINDVLVGEVKCPPQLAQFAGSSNLPVGFRVVNIAATDVARQLSVGYVNVGQGDQNTNKPWSHAMAGSGQGSYQVQIGGTPGPTVVRGSGANGHPTSGTTRIAGTWNTTTTPALNSLGGLWTSPAMNALAPDADYPVFSYLNPFGTAALPGKTLYITGIRIGDTYVTTAPGASSNIFLSYIVTVESSAAATSTADSATTVSGKSTVLGGHGFGNSSTDPVGTMKPGFEMRFESPLMVPAGLRCNIIVRPFASTTAGNTLVVTGSVAINGYFE
jgi:hypothetical protein